MYYDGAFQSSWAGPAYEIYHLQSGGETSACLNFMYGTGTGAGSVVTMTPGIVLNSSGNVGIGTTIPSTLMEVGSGGASGKFSVYSQDNTYGQFQIGNPNSNAEASMVFISGVTAFGNAATSTSGNSYIWGMGTGPYGIGGNKFAITNVGYGGPIVTLTSAGNVGIGNTSPTYPLTISSTSTTSYSNYEYMTSSATGNLAGSSGSIGVSLYAQGRILCASEIDVTSDRRLKDTFGNINPQYALAAITKLKPVHFRWKKDVSKDQALIAGFYAQEVHQVIPEAVTITQGMHFADEHTLNYDMLTTYAIAAIQEQQKMIEEEKKTASAASDAQQAKLDSQQTTIDELKKEVEVLKQQIANLAGNPTQTVTAKK